MLVRTLVAALLLLACDSGEGIAPTPQPPSPPKALTPKQIIDHREVGKLVTVDIIEPILDHTMSSLPVEGEYDVDVVDVGPSRFLLSPAKTIAARKAGALDALPKGLHAPIRVRGVIDIGRHDDWTVIVVHEITPIAPPKVERLASARQLITEPAKWKGKLVEVEDDYLFGFEASYLSASRPGEAIWVDYDPAAKIACEPKDDDRDLSSKTAHVRVRGYAYTGGNYGHLGASKAMIVATAITFLDPSRAQCR